MEHKQSGKFKVGQKVWLEHTREEAIIKRIDKSGILYVDASGDVIPVFMSQVTRRMPVGKDGEDVKDLKEGKDENGLVENVSKIDKTKIVKPRVALLFVPSRLSDGEIVKYDLGIMNETSEAFNVRIDLVRNDGDEIINGLVNAYDYKTLKKFEAEKLNDLVAIRIRITPVDESLDVFESEQKIKPSSFIKKNDLVESLGVEAYVYELMDRFLESPVKIEKIWKSEKKEKMGKNIEDVIDKEETIWKFDDLRLMMLDRTELKENLIATSTNNEKEIDLHAEAFLKDTIGLSATDILLLQLERFRKALERAIFSGQKVLLIVHGVGKGKLKKEIEKILDDDERVIDYRDASYPKYGYGATEVILR